MAFSQSSGIWQIDGVPVKLGDKFHAPQKVTLPLDFTPGNPSDILFTEYDFGLEESVVRWCDERREAARREEEEQRLQQEREQQAQAALEAEKIKTDPGTVLSGEDMQNVQSGLTTGSNAVTATEVEYNFGMLEDEANEKTQGSDQHVAPSGVTINKYIADGPEDLDSEQGLTISGEVPTADKGHVSQPVVRETQPRVTQTVTSTVVANGVAKSLASDTQVLQPFYGGANILQPMRVGKPNQNHNGQISQNAVGSLDYTQFEKEGDVFDNMELQTLDEMAELNQVLLTAQKPAVSFNNNNANRAPHSASVVRQSNNVQNVSTGTEQKGINTQQGVEAQASRAQRTAGERTAFGHENQNQTTVVSAKPVTDIRPVGVQSSVASSKEPQVNIVPTSAYVSVNMRRQSTGSGRLENGAVHQCETQNVTTAQTSTNLPWQVTYKSLKDVDYPDLDSPDTDSSVSLNKGQVFYKPQGLSNMQGASTQSQPAAAVYTTNKKPTDTTSYHTNQGASSLANGMYSQFNNMSAVSFIPTSNVNLSSHYTSGNHFIHTGAATNTTPATKQMTDFEKIFGSRNFMRHSQQHHLLDYKTPYRHSTDSQFKSQSRGASPTPDVPKLRSARSVPDLTALHDMAKVQMPSVSHTPPPERSRTPVELTVRKSSLSSAGKQSTKSPLPNPYHGLNPESKRLVDGITVMGFPLDRVARAVEKLGTDDKRVIDYLCFVNKFTDAGSSVEDVEHAVQLYDDSEEKITHYLKMVQQFRAFGFDEDKIQEALAKYDSNEEKVLDFLTAS